MNPQSLQQSPRVAPVAVMSHQGSNDAQNRSGLSPNVAMSHHLAQGPRNLPSQNISEDTIEDAYVQFMFFCNPSLPLSTDTAELRKGFQSMPKTDGKTFEIFHLFELIRRLELKQLDTWSALVVEMGVEPPDPSKNQSTQKVQQYAVRLKRWLHAFHIDAFFQYCLGKPNNYYMDIPADPEVTATTIRDGVAPEEDLALRALVPEWRPKRGRRRNDHLEPDGAPSAKRAQRATSLTADDKPPEQPGNIYPQSAFPWDRPSNQGDPWAAAHRAILPRPLGPPTTTPHPSQTPASSHHNFWMDIPDTTTTEYPQSALDHPQHPHSAFPATSTPTPQSAHPLSHASPRIRKRHGPSVSAAWPSSTSSSTGKLRGRPPSNRTIQDGPFSTFPAKGSPSSATGIGAPPTPSSANPNSPFVNASTAFPPPTPTRKPSKLQLQVPQHAGGPVRLATPPPKVMINGGETINASQMQGQGQLQPPFGTQHQSDRRSSADFFNTVDDESEMGVADDSGGDDDDTVDWKRRAMALKRKVKELEGELKAVKRRVLDAVM